MASSKDKLYFPWFTILLSAWCIVVYVLWYNQSLNVENKNLFADIGAPYAIQIYQGQYWGVFTNSFIHINIAHLLLNILGLWLFSAYLERRIQFTRLFFFGLFASILTSLVQLTLTDDAGVGLYGVNYTLFGFILGKSIRNERFKLKLRYIYFILAIVLIGISFYLNKYYSFQIGVEAMISGLSIGIIIGFLTELKNRIIAPTFIVITLSMGVLTLFTAPWSAEWNYYKGYEYHDKFNFVEAKKYYRRALEINPTHSISRSNLFLINVEELSDLALNAHENENYLEAKVYYDKLLLLDPNNSWAKENLAKLP